MGQTCELTVANILPPFTVLLIVVTTWSTYTFGHLLPKLQHFDEQVVCQGWFQLFISQYLTAMLLICYSRALLTSPGEVPESLEWQLTGPEDTHHLKTHERKFSGQRRRCKHCLVYKPDRCHHCRVCKSCILKMDHHCPWIMNCVGFRNHKYFFLLVVYSMLSCLYICITVFESFWQASVLETTTLHRYLLAQCLVCSSVMGFLLSLFLSFHGYLMMKGLTTIEYCEKSAVSKAGRNAQSQYDLGTFGNLQAVLGGRPWLWLLPLDPPAGDGLWYVTQESSGSADPEWTSQSWVEN